jgi:hypothetical protein
MVPLDGTPAGGALPLPFLEVIATNAGGTDPLPVTETVVRFGGLTTAAGRFASSNVAGRSSEIVLCRWPRQLGVVAPRAGVSAEGRRASARNKPSM